MIQTSPPTADKRPQTDTRHGKTRTDDYAWLRDDNWQQVMREPEVLDKDIRAYLEAENVYTKSILDPLSGDIETLFAEMKGRIKQDDSSVPLLDGLWAYYRRYRDGGEHPLFCRTPRDGGTEAMIFDGDAEAEGHAYFKLAACEHSPDHRYLAYAVDINGSEIFTLRVRDLDSGEDLPDAIESVSGSFEWANDSRTLFYTVLDDNHRPCAVRRHQLGAAREDDAEVYKESDPGFFVSIGKTESQRFLVIDAHDHQTSEARVLDADDLSADWQMIAERDSGHEYDVSDWHGAFLIRTNDDGAEDFKIVSAPHDNPGRENWSEMVAHEPGRLILGFQAFKDFWVRLERVNALPRLIVSDKMGGEHAVAFDEDAYALGLNGAYEFDTASLRFTYSSMTTPERTFDYDMATRQRVLRKQQVVPSGHDPADYVTRRIEAPAEDGETVPVSLLYHKDTALDGSAALLLYGYGAYGMSMPAAFSTARLSLVDRGFVYAIAHIRGGMEKGYRWYKAGRAENKTNTFNDFIAAAEALVEAKYTSTGRIVAHGGSAGGMLMGAVANMAPKLFGAIAADVPFVDVLNTMLDESLPLTPPEWPEWGNPIEDAEAFARIAAYSPYDNVAARDYPHIYVTAGLTDPRVTYWEPAKWVAKLRALKTDANTLCLKTNMEAGHGGAAGRFQRLKETAEIYAFVLNVMSSRKPENLD
jgi:oligopeptidase B